MSLLLPPQGSPVRDLFEVPFLVELYENRSKIPAFRQGLYAARVMMEKDDAIRSVNMFVLRANGELWLVKFGPRGGWKKLWNFGML